MPNQNDHRHAVIIRIHGDLLFCFIFVLFRGITAYRVRARLHRATIYCICHRTYT